MSRMRIRKFISAHHLVSATFMTASAIWACLSLSVFSVPTIIKIDFCNKWFHENTHVPVGSHSKYLQVPVNDMFFFKIPLPHPQLYIWMLYGEW